MTQQTTKVHFSQKARDGMLKGMEIAANAVGCTLGPKGKTVIIKKESDLAPIVTKDGVTVSKSINLADKLQALGADLIKEAANKTNDVAGDGTTTSTVLTYALCHQGAKLVELGHAPKNVCAGIAKAGELISQAVLNSAKKLSTSDEIAQVGTISANGDVKIGQLIAEAMSKVGSDGIITVEDSKSTTTMLEIADGMLIDRGYLSPFFVTNQEKMHALYMDSYVLVTDKKISKLVELIPLLEKVIVSKRSLLIIADEVEGEALQGLVLNRVKSSLPVVAIKAPGFGSIRDKLLNDICALTGATLVSSLTGVGLDTVNLSQLGQLKKVVVDAKSTTLVALNNVATLAPHVSNLKAQLNDPALDVEEFSQIKTRLARLASGVAVIKVGGTTEVEMIEKKYRIEDALHATRAAVEEGIVAGGGMALLKAVLQVKKSEWEFLNASEQAGFDAALIAFKSPFEKIVSNAGHVPEVVLNNLERAIGFDQHVGFNASNSTEVDMFEAGIIDPCKVTRTAIANSVSVANMFINLDAVIIEENTNDK